MNGMVGCNNSSMAEITKHPVCVQHNSLLIMNSQIYNTHIHQNVSMDEINDKDIHL